MVSGQGCCWQASCPLLGVTCCFQNLFFLPAGMSHSLANIAAANLLIFATLLFLLAGMIHDQVRNAAEFLALRRSPLLYQANADQPSLTTVPHGHYD